ncbi:FecR family protein [Marinifilum sp.]|uniref:FecR family protein n=1 Tax=Marinifilum sp. TaxID=2033137 RepID=UPI003BAD274E
MKDNILDLIADKLSGEINDEHNKLLMNWMNESDQNKKIYSSYAKLFADIKNLKNKNLVIDEQYNLSVVKDKILKKQKRRVLVNRVMYAAVAVLLPAIIFIAVFYSSQTPVVDTLAKVEEIAPGVKKAQLILSTGERIELSDTLLNITNIQQGVEISNENSKLNYSASNESAQKMQYNTLIVGRGEEYQLALADGTQVWLNSESVLKYPVSFSGSKREVELKGEAYFEVAHNAEKPFLVNTKEMNVAVLGTSFNVSAYPDDEAVHTTLIEGSVKVHNNMGEGSEAILSPNQQFVYNKTKNQVQVNTVNARFYSEWKDGAFTFIDEPLPSIMKKMERWYKIRVFFQGQDVQNLRFSGKLKRFNTCNEVLEVISKTSHISFEIQGDRNVIIRQ